MVGLSVVLEGGHKTTSLKCPQVISKATVIKPSPLSPTSPSSSSKPLQVPMVSFLDECFLCKQRLLPGKDIYMYNGDRAFCSTECRCRYIVMDEENSGKATKKSSASSSSSSGHQKRNKNRAGAFAF